MSEDKHVRNIEVKLVPEWMNNKNYSPYFTFAAYVGRGYVNKSTSEYIINKNLVKRILKDYCGLTDYKINQSAKELKALKIMIEQNNNYIFKWLPDEKPFIYIAFETAVYCLDNLSPFVTKLYTYLLWEYNYHKERCKKNGFSFFEDPYCISLCGLGSVLGFSKSKNTNTKVLSALETLRKVGLIDFEKKYYYKTLENGQITHFYKIDNVYSRSSVQKSIAKWAKDDPEIAAPEEVVFDIINEEQIEIEKQVIEVEEKIEHETKDKIETVNIENKYNNKFVTGVKTVHVTMDQILGKNKPRRRVR